MILPESSPDRPPATPELAAAEPATPEASATHEAATAPATAEAPASLPAPPDPAGPRVPELWAQLLPGAATPTVTVDAPAYRTRRWVALAVGAVVLLVLAGVVVAIAASGASTPAAAPSRTATSLFDQPDTPSPVPSPSASSEAPAPVWTPNHTGDLARFLVPMPAGAKPTKTKPANETLDIDKASAYGATPEIWKAQLYTWEFSRAVVRRWTLGAEGFEVVLFQFYNPENAAGFGAWLKQGQETSTEWRSINAATYGSVFVSTTTTAGFVTQLAMAVNDDIVVSIQANAKPSSDSSVIENLLYAEYHLL